MGMLAEAWRKMLSSNAVIESIKIIQNLYSMKKLSRHHLKNIKGENASICNGCPAHITYGPGVEYTGTCENYFALPDYCRDKNCVRVSRSCFGNS